MFPSISYSDTKIDLHCCLVTLSNTKKNKYFQKKICNRVLTLKKTGAITHKLYVRIVNVCLSKKRFKTKSNSEKVLHSVV